LLTIILILASFYQGLKLFCRILFSSKGLDNIPALALVLSYWLECS